MSLFHIRTSLGQVPLDRHQSVSFKSWKLSPRPLGARQVKVGGRIETSPHLHSRVTHQRCSELREQSATISRVGERRWRRHPKLLTVSVTIALTRSGHSRRYTKRWWRHHHVGTERSEIHGTRKLRRRHHWVPTEGSEIHGTRKLWRWHHWVPTEGSEIHGTRKTWSKPLLRSRKLHA
ncbi:hypothetical protein RvY_18426-1 [Ramazzottius varieornatus]|uniref:Uncharacterized protein n=1 Tax=Ramazzottius varieornatus TaxID=947166 RepID=A0A1D1W7A4_RAMVA|nr:hypothetical protein RvY_18426-1 [Ramazzottius varieornatus]